jgi:RNA polymerase sigma-70 factor (ECF subfamily)
MDGARDKESRCLRLVAGTTTSPRLPRSAAKTGEAGDVAAAFLDGDRSILDEVVRANAARVFAVVRRYARAPQDARDLAQEAFRRALAAALRALRRDPQRAVPLGRWLMRTTLKVARDHLRDEVCLAGARLDELGAAGAPRPNAYEPRLGDERVTQVRSEVLQLPARQREVLTLCIDPELAFSDIAAVLRITEAAAVLNFHDAARRLRDVAEGCKPGASACARYEVLLSSRAVGALERGEAGTIEAHLAGCSACSAVADATEDALRLAALGPASAGGGR